MQQDKQIRQELATWSRNALKLPSILGAISSDLYRTKKIAEFLNITLDQLKIRLITLSRSEDQENTLGQACFYSFLKL